MGAAVIAASCRLASLPLDGWVVSPQGVERIWRQERLKMAQKQPQRGGLWLAPGPCVSLWLCGPKQTRSYDFAMKYNYGPYREIFHTLKEVQIPINPWRWDYNKVGPQCFGVSTTAPRANTVALRNPYLPPGNSLYFFMTLSVISMDF